MKKLIVSILLLLLVLPVVTGASSPLKPDSSIKVYVNNERITFDVDPVVINGTTLVQFTPIFKALGITYDWYQETYSIKASKGKQSILLQIGNPIVSVNDNNIMLSATPTLFDSRTLVPLRFVSESTGMLVDWHKDTKEIRITKNSNPKVYDKPDYSQLMMGADFTMNKRDVLAIIKTEPDRIVGDEFSFSEKELFGYKGILTAGFDVEDKLSSYSYNLVMKDQAVSPLVVYRDIMEQLSVVFGPPSKQEVIKKVGEDRLEVTSTVTDTEIIRGLRNDTYEVRANWWMSEIRINTMLLRDGEDIIIYVSYKRGL